MNNIESNQADCLFKVNQIICLEHQAACLYGEVIQLIPQRGMCWFRPLYLIQNNDSSDRSRQKISFSQWESADLLWPTELFRPAWDTEVMLFLGEINNDYDHTAKVSSRQHLHQFIKEVWAANREQFS